MTLTARRRLRRLRNHLTHWVPVAAMPLAVMAAVVILFTLVKGGLQ